jgi:hypothetical protein
MFPNKKETINSFILSFEIIEMNTNGYNLNITSQYTEEDPFELEKEYWFSEWYPIIEHLVYTPKSYIQTYKDLYNGRIDKIIQALPNKECFARLDTLSSKPNCSYKNSFEIIRDFKHSDRTRDYFTEEMKVIIREYLPLKDIEWRCFIHNKKLRAISSEGKLRTIDIAEIQLLVDKITFYTEYDSYCVDMTFHNNKIMVIEINTPVWLFGSSGLFYLDEPADAYILLGDYIPDVLTYPVIKYD